MLEITAPDTASAPGREALLRLWTGALRRGETDVAPLLDAVVAVAREVADGTPVGLCWAYASNVEMLGGRRFLVVETDVVPDASHATQPLRDAAFARLSAAPATDDPDPPVGACLPIADRTELAARPEAVWDGDPPWAYAGYLPDGRQLRIAYAAGARVGSGGQR